MEEQESWSIIVVQENLDSTVRTQSVLWNINGGYFWAEELYDLHVRCRWSYCPVIMFI